MNLFRKAAHNKGTAMIITLVVVVIFIGYSVVLSTNSLVESRDARLAVANMSALYLAESGLDTYLIRLQADPGNAIRIPLSSAAHPGVGEDWQGITLSDGIHYFVSPLIYVPKEQLNPDGILIPDLGVEDNLYGLPQAEDGTGISAADANPANRKIYSNAAGSFFLRMAYFRPTAGVDGILGNDDDVFLPWAGDTDSSGIAFDPETFAIQLSAVAHLNPRAETIVSQQEGFLDLDNDGAFTVSDEVVEANAILGRQSTDYRRVTYEAVRIVEGSLRSSSSPDISKLFGGAIINLGVDETGGVGGGIKFSDPGANTIIMGNTISNTGAKVGSTSFSTSTGFSSNLKNSANYLDNDGFPVFRFGWIPTLLAVIDSNGDPIIWDDLDIVNPTDGTRLFKAPYSLSGGNVVDSSTPPKIVPSDYTDILQTDLYGTADELDTGMVTAGSDSQLFNISQYVAVAAGTQVIDPISGSTTTVPGKYLTATGVEKTTFAGGVAPSRTATGDIDWGSDADVKAFHGPAGWVFRDNASFVTAMKREGEMHGVVILNYTADTDIYTSNLKDASTNPTGAINIKGTLVFRFDSSFDPSDKIKIGARLQVNPAEFPTYSLTGGLDGGTVEEQRLFDLRGTMIPPNDPLFFNYDGSAPSGYPDTQAKKDAFYDATHGVAGEPTVFPERIDVSAYDDPSKVAGTKYKNLGEGITLPDYPALMFNQSTVDIHGNANICGAVFGPAYAEIENKGEGTTPLWHYFVGAIIVGDGINVKNEASGSLFSSSIPAISEHWKASVFVYQPTHINNLAIESEFIPGSLDSWNFVSTTIRR